MSTYKDQPLFASGPHRFHAHGLSLRTQTIEQPGSDGATVLSLGRTARRIDQQGTLTADTLSALQQQIDAIETAMDGQDGELIDDLGRSWLRMVMTDLSLSRIERVGVRLHVNYNIQYLQTKEILELPL